MIHNPELRTKPMAVTQKYLCVTANYPARERGVGKLMRIDRARAACPELILVNGEDLTRYRAASQQLFAIMRRYSSSAQRLGLDEVFLDVTTQVEALDAFLSRRAATAAVAAADAAADGAGAGSGAGSGAGTGARAGAVTAASSVPARVFQGHVVGSPTAATACRCGCTRRLQLGSMLLAEIRDSIFREAGYTTTGGVATSKMLSKFAASMHKPNQQTTMLPHAVFSLMSSMPTRKLPGVGYKLGRQLRELHLTTVAQLRKLPVALLNSYLGEPTGQMVYELCRGVDSSAVVETVAPKTISDEDSFKRCSSAADAQRRLADILASLLIRVDQDVEQFARYPTVLRLSVRHHRGRRYGSRVTRSCRVPTGLFRGVLAPAGTGPVARLPPQPHGRRVDHVAAETQLRVRAVLPTLMQMLGKLVELGKPFHLTLINIAVTGFQTSRPSYDVGAMLKAGAQTGASSGDTRVAAGGGA